MSKRPDDRRAATRRAIREMEEEDAALSRELEMELTASWEEAELRGYRDNLEADRDGWYDDYLDADDWAEMD